MIQDISSIEFPLLLDGGLSNVLEEKGCDLNQSLWSAEMLLNAQQEIVQTHLDYLWAGSDLITTCSYQVSFPGFAQRGLSPAHTEKALRNSVELAEQAVKLYREETGTNKRVYIAASLGPYGAYLADGSEYTGRYGVSEEELSEFHKRRIRIMEDTDADFIAMETIPSKEEALILSGLLREVKKPSWISFSCEDGQRLRDGSNLELIVKALKDHPKVFALGANCTEPSYMAEIIERIRKSAPDKKVIVYPNSGEQYSAKDKTWHGRSDQVGFARMAEQWLALGASIIGGCCRTGPGHIQSIRDSVF
jgi:homocysteine S-methyltransferase